MSYKNQPVSGSSGTASQRDDDDIVIIEPVIPIIDLCTPSAVATDWSRLESYRTRNVQMMATPVSSTKLLDKPVANAQAQRPNNDRSGSDSIKCACCLLSPLNRKPHATMCGHVFCGQCIRRALISKKECPVCRNFTCTTTIIELHI